MKKIAIMAALAVSAVSAFAGTTVGVDYAYLRATGGSYLAQHTAVATAKQSFGALGNVKLGVGNVQDVTSIRDNGNVLSAEYSYDFSTPVGKLSPAASVSRVTGVQAGNVDSYALSATLRTPIAQGSRLVTSVGHAEGWNGTDYRATSAGVGVELDVAKNFVFKGGYAYTRLHTVERNANTIAAGLEYRF